MDGTSGISLYGRIFLRGAIEIATGLHIGEAPGALAIGGVDNAVIRDVLTRRPYVPGSSLKGKMRSLSERVSGVEQNWSIGQGVKIHVCTTRASYEHCPVCPVFGVLGQSDASSPTRLVVRDAYLDDESAARLERARTDPPFTEVKWEAAIDRVTSAATPRQVERVPAGAVFRPFEMILSVYEPRDTDGFRTLARAMQLLQDDYLGGLGSRGGGKVRFADLEVFAKSRDGYERPESARQKRTFVSLEALLTELDDVVAWLDAEVPVA